MKEPGTRGGFYASPCRAHREVRVFFFFFFFFFFKSTRVKFRLVDLEHFAVVIIELLARCLVLAVFWRKRMNSGFSFFALWFCLCAPEDKPGHAL